MNYQRIHLASIVGLLGCLCLVSCEKMAADFMKGWNAGGGSAAFATLRNYGQPIQAAPAPTYSAPVPPVQQYGSIIRTHAYDLRCYAMHNYINQLGNGIAPKGDQARAAWQEYKRLYALFQQLYARARTVISNYDRQISRYPSSSNPGRQLSQQRRAIKMQFEAQLRKIALAGDQFNSYRIQFLKIILGDDEAWELDKQNRANYSFIFMLL